MGIFGVAEKQQLSQSGSSARRTSGQMADCRLPGRTSGTAQRGQPAESVRFCRFFARNKVERLQRLGVFVVALDAAVPERRRGGVGDELGE